MGLLRCNFCKLGQNKNRKLYDAAVSLTHDPLYFASNMMSRERLISFAMKKGSIIKSSMKVEVWKRLQTDDKEASGSVAMNLRLRT